MFTLATLRARRDDLAAALRKIHDEAGDRTLTAPEQERWDAIESEQRDIESGIADLEAREARDGAVAARRAKWGSTQVNAVSTSTAAWDGLDVRGTSPEGWVSRAQAALDRTDGLSDEARSRLSEAIAEPEDGHVSSRFIVARSNPAYLSAFTKVLRSPERAYMGFTPDEARAFAAVEEARAALGTGTGTGGYLIPLALDPNLSAIVHAGVTNPFRAVAAVKTTVSSPGRAVTSTGINAAWVAEGVAFGDNTPTFDKVDIPLYKLAAFINATYEVFEDAGSAIVEALPPLLADARDRAEGDAFSIGSGSAAPKGVVTAVAAASGFVTATTRGSFTSASAVDVLAVINALPPRARNSGRVAWFANIAHILTVRQMNLGTSGGLFVSAPAMASDNVTNIYGAPMLEASAMASGMTSGSYLAVAGDFSKYQIVDSVAGPSLEFVPIVFDQATGRPNGTRGWVYYQRTGADCLDPSQFKILKA